MENYFFIPKMEGNVCYFYNKKDNHDHRGMIIMEMELFSVTLAIASVVTLFFFVGYTLLTRPEQ